MLEVKNIIEDVILDIIRDMDDYKNGQLKQSQVIEIASYVLNRTHSMYITSNKGFTNMISKYKNDPQFFADIMLLINDAMKVINLTNISSVRKEELDYNVPYYVLPKMYGKIISSQSYLPLDGAVVSLFINDELIQSIFQDWNNPLEILKQDNGIYTFAPIPQKAESPFTSREYSFKIIIEKAGKSFEKSIIYETSPVILQNQEIDFNENILQIEDIYVSFQ